MNLVRALGISAAGVVASSWLAAGVAAAAVTVPFQVDPAPFGNPNGSFDAPPVRCAVVVGDRPGSATITGGKPGRWGCPLSSEVHWLNLSTGASGSGRLSDGLNGIPAEATLHTGAGQVVVALLPQPGPITPGFAAFSVP
ncbi:hypothetical protein [Rhodococcus sp. NPDC127528]|uniref:hypothetical protein n=1 Tax=unclassified Rhodococcus (in: high G+C Gram-positive bacteria) TaxID=192944 RepID=UPI00363937AD